MNIFMIGNGFDLEHGLPTKYSNFLDFIMNFKNQSYKNCGNENVINYFDELFSKHKDKVTKLNNLVDKNIWFEYFSKNINYNKENWIDFETEISKVIQLLEVARKEYYNKAKIDTQSITETVSHRVLKDLFSECPSLKNICSEYKCFLFNKIITRDEYFTPTTKHFKSLKKVIYKYCYRPYYSKKIFEKWSDILISDLNKLIEALEFYLYDYVYKIEITINNPDIYNIINPLDNNRPTIRLLSFNYTNTFSKVYSDFLKNANVEYHYIHGKVREEYVESNNMVLGIDEYLKENQRSKNIDFIKFQKYFQRIQKRTGSNYQDWLKTINENETSTNLYIFGHSLDVTDKDIIQELILNKNITTTIFYFDQQAYEKLISNLIRIIGKEELIKKAYKNSPSIIFKQQKRSVSKKNT